MSLRSSPQFLRFLFSQPVCSVSSFPPSAGTARRTPPLPTLLPRWPPCFPCAAPQRRAIEDAVRCPARRSRPPFTSFAHSHDFVKISRRPFRCSQLACLSLCKPPQIRSAAGRRPSHQPSCELGAGSGASRSMRIEGGGHKAIDIQF